MSGISALQKRTPAKDPTGLVRVPPPAGLNFTSPVPYTIYRTGLGLYVVDINVASLRPPAGTTYYIAPSGSSGNTGLDSGHPIRIQDALAKSDVGTIICTPGEYFRNTNLANSITTKSVNIIGQTGAILTGFEQPSSLTWTLQSGSIYQTTLATSALCSVVDKNPAYISAAGDYPLYTQVANLASITGPGQWAVSGTTAYVWALGNLNLATNGSYIRMNLDVTSTVLHIKGPYTLYIEGLQIEGGGSITSDLGTVNAVSTNSGNPTLIMVDTTIKYSPAEGVIAQGTAFSLYIRCTVAETGNDGISYKEGTATGPAQLPQGIEIDCITRSTAVFDPSQTGNGTTTHGGSKVIRVNGTYRSSYGPPVADDSGSYTWNLGCVAGSSTATTRYWAYCASTSGVQMWLEDCAADPSPNHPALYAYDATSAIHVRRGRTGSLLGMSSVAGPGTIDTY